MANQRCPIVGNHAKTKCFSMISKLAWNAQIHSWDHFEDPETRRIPQRPPGTLQGHPGPPPGHLGIARRLPRHAQRSPSTFPMRPTSPQGAPGRPGIAHGSPRDAQGACNEPKQLPKSPQGRPRDQNELPIYPERGTTITRVISTGLPVSFALYLCSSLWVRGWHTHARHISRWSCQSPAFPPAQLIPLRILGCGGPA